ncbi:hypothetical protein CAPTEDRAFT_153561 [Capitella teleta]|uniref:Large ribosomal subunit protein mL54 n=1 Tax=Capitella teleta TaxID=283909 RepID=R7VDL5_CAPTE|nr:hypothetical protein CAPTEDRAFT_153561 [Capitella teleta]|eukprot:ELU14406.1 hypothetical protein CAPTEDRAFT_153561 [Capitella teleta]
MTSVLKLSQQLASISLAVSRSPSTKLLLTRLPVHTSSASYAKKPIKGAAPGVNQRKFLDVEKDPVLLTTRLVGGNINKEGEDPILEEDSEYPDWLWELRTERGVLELDEMSKDSLQYWKRLARLERKKVNVLRKTRNAYKYY